MNKLILFCIPLLLSCEHKESTLDFSDIEVGSDVRNYHFGKDFYNKKEVTDEYYHYDIYDDTIYKKVTIEEVLRKEKSTYYFPIDSTFSEFRFGAFTPKGGNINVYNGKIRSFAVGVSQEQLSEFVKYLYKKFGTPYSEDIEKHERGEEQSYYDGSSTFEILKKVFPERIKNKNTILCPTKIYWKKGDVYYILRVFDPTPPATIEGSLLCIAKHPYPTKYDLSEIKMGNNEKKYHFDKDENIEISRNHAWNFYQTIYSNYDDTLKIKDIKEYRINIDTDDSEGFSEYRLYNEKKYRFASYPIKYAKMISYKGKMVSLYVDTYSNDFTAIYKYLQNTFGSPFYVYRSQIGKERMETQTFDALMRTFPEYIEVFHLDPLTIDEPEYIARFGGDEGAVTAPIYMLWEKDGVFCRFQVLQDTYDTCKCEEDKKNSMMRIDNNVLIVIPKDSLNPNFSYSKK